VIYQRVAWLFCGFTNPNRKVPQTGRQDRRFGKLRYKRTRPEQGNRLVSAKSRELIDLEYNWKPQDKNLRDAALKKLDVALTDATKLEGVLKCLKDTLKSKTLKCDPKTL
jgi:hypothetical protein